MTELQAQFEEWLNQGHRNGAIESMWKAWCARARLYPARNASQTELLKEALVCLRKGLSSNSLADDIEKVFDL